LRQLIYFLGLALLLLLVGSHTKWTAKPTKVPIPSKLALSEIRKRNFIGWVPVLTVKPAKQTWEGWRSLSLASLALFAASGLWLFSRQRYWLPQPAPEAEPEPVRKGPPRVFLTPPQLADPQLLTPKEQEILVWGITHMVADEPTRRLDLTATVKKTARAGGITHPVFHQKRHPREVWLWIDEAADDPAIYRIANEIEISLRTHALPTELAVFRGIPGWLVDSNGNFFRPNEIDERRDAALVAILTDGRLLARQYAADDRRVQIEALLRSLSVWPQLAVVDFGATPGGLASILAKHSLKRIIPAQLASFLGCDEVASHETSVTGTGYAPWAAACALAPTSVDEATVFEIRRRLNLGISPWMIRALRAEAPSIPGRLQWSPEDRARRINWLREAEAQPIGGVAHGSLLERALGFWEEAYDRELRMREREDTEGAWRGMPACQHLAMERAFLSLWRDAPSAILQLYRLYSGSMRQTIKRQLSEMAPLDWGGADLVHLPWLWTERSASERAMLQEMGLGGGMPPTILRRPGRLWLALGICAGLAMGALLVGVLDGLWKPAVEVIEWNRRPESAFTELEQSTKLLRRWTVIAGTPDALARKEVPESTEVEIKWETRELPCVSKHADIEEWRCGTIGRSPDATLRTAFLDTPPSTPGVDARAVELLDKKLVDLVVIGEKGWTGYTALPKTIIEHYAAKPLPPHKF
jgi:hypothetical protein